MDTSRAEGAAWVRACRPKRCKLATNVRLRRVVAAKLGEDWSPQQIAGWLARAYPDDPEMRVSHETIYLTLFVQARGALRRELTAHLPHQAGDAQAAYPHRPRAWPRSDRGSGGHLRATCRG